MMSTSDLEYALNGDRHAMDAYLELRGGDEIIADIKALLASKQGDSLRDCFAAKAMHAIYMRFGGSPSAGNDYDGCLTHAAKDAYAMADAMIKAREA
jgi:hypothetical protein